MLNDSEKSTPWIHDLSMDEWLISDNSPINAELSLKESEKKEITKSQHVLDEDEKAIILQNFFENYSKEKEKLLEYQETEKFLIKGCNLDNQWHGYSTLQCGSFTNIKNVSTCINKFCKLLNISYIMEVACGSGSATIEILKELNANQIKKVHCSDIIHSHLEEILENNPLPEDIRSSEHMLLCLEQIKTGDEDLLDFYRHNIQKKVIQKITFDFEVEFEKKSMFDVLSESSKIFPEPCIGNKLAYIICPPPIEKHIAGNPLGSREKLLGLDVSLLVESLNTSINFIAIVRANKRYSYCDGDSYFYETVEMLEKSGLWFLINLTPNVGEQPCGEITRPKKWYRDFLLYSRKSIDQLKCEGYEL
jgi:hypothetical protein